MMSKRAQKVAHKGQPRVSLMLSLHLDIFCDLLLYRPMETWSLFVLYNKKNVINPLHPNVSMHILHTVLYMFLKVLTRRIWLAM